MSVKSFAEIKLNKKTVALAAAAVILCVVFFAVVFTLSITPAIALEQELRCGMEEHVHDDSCYDGDFLVCTTPGHTHNGNCYILLLNENDINGVMTIVEDDADQSLESVISNVMTTAASRSISVSEDGTSEGSSSGSSDSSSSLNHSGSTEGLTQAAVMQMNSTIAEEESLPNLVLNENLNTMEFAAVQDTQQQAGGASAYAVGDSAVTSSYNANFYVYLDGKWTCIGSLPFGTTKNGSRYNATIPTSDVLNLVNTALSTEYAYNSFDISTSTSLNSGYSISNGNVGMGSVTTVVAYRQSSSNVKAVRYVRLIPNNGSASSTEFAFHTVEFIYPDGTAVTQYVRSGTAVTMPEGNYTWTSGSNTYTAGQSVTIRSKTTFTGALLGPPTYMNIHYDVNFPTVSGVTYNTAPTLAGLSATTVRDEYTENSTVTIRNVSQQSVKGSVRNNNTGLSRVAQFKGWRIGNSDVIIQPNTSLVWEELVQYSNNSTALRLYGVWETEAVRTATFFIRFDSVAVDTDGNITGQDSNKYTNELFAAHVGGIDTSKSVSQLHNLYHIADTTADNSYGADQEIRALYGEKAEGAWLSAFPTDDYIFESLVQYANTGYLSVDDVPVKAEDLNDREYAIRWYVFKAQDDAWHIDGKLVKKQGLIHVYKTFAGNKELIEAAKSGFHINASNASGSKTTVLNLDSAESYDSATDTYMWEITDVDYGEQWTLTEYPAAASMPQGYSVFSEYSVMNPHGDVQSYGGTGTTMSVSGMTYALDEGVDEVLRATFNNIYNRSDSIIIKKQDSNTGVSIGGASFQLLQNDRVLKFNYNSTTDSYEYAPVNGTQTVLSGNANGYFEISVEDFSYDEGPITIREITAPTGYTPIGDIEIGYTDSRNTVGIIGGNSELIKYVNGVLIVGNSTESASVTAKKAWECPQNEWQDVRVQLMANGRLATAIIAGVEPEVTLSSSNGWQYTWDNLPIYVNGQKIDWTIKEVQIGSERHKADGSFVNWLASYSIPVKTTDSDGNEHITLTVTNTTKRVMLRLTKTNTGKSILLPKASFLLEAVDASGNVLANEVAKSGTTDSSGILIFDNMKTNVRYRLTETVTPDGYLPMEEYIYFTINEDGSVTVEESYYAEAGNTAYNITVMNAEAVTLPDSGGPGHYMFYIVGLLLIAAACKIYKNDTLRERRCRR